MDGRVNDTVQIPIIEIFGPTIQGEGNLMGTKTIFIRTAGCDYSCSWCDSKYSWQVGLMEPRLLTPIQILNEVQSLDNGAVGWVTISGGNPALIHYPMKKLIDLLHEAGYKVALETQGSKWQPWMIQIDNLVISPKPPSSGMKTDYILLDTIINNVLETKNTLILKVVIFDDNDYGYAKALYLKYEKQLQVYLQVGNGNLEETNIEKILLNKLAWLTEKLIQDKEMKNAIVLPQLHALIWGNKRGV